ncbi:MAG: 6-bladed beta-propeller [Nitrososphaeraceae archaeon]
MKSTRQDVVVLVLTILVSFSLIKGIVLLTSTVANADVNDPFAQNLTKVKQGRESLDPILTGQLNLKLEANLSSNDTSPSSGIQENFTRKSNSYNESSSVFVTNKGENSSVIDTIEQIRDKPALQKDNLISTNGSSNETRVKSGQVFVVDYANIRIEKFDPNGHFITKWGSQGNSDSQFRVPHSIAADLSNNIYVTDMTALNVKKFDSDGHFITKWGTKGTGEGQFNHPHGIVVDKLGSIYVTDMQNFNIQKFDSDGHFITKWGTKGTGDGQLKRPAGIAVDSLDNIYVSNAGNDRIEKFDNDGKFITKWGSLGKENGHLDTPHDIAVDELGNLYVVEQGNFRVQVFSTDGKFITKWGSPGSNDNQFLDPHSIVVTHPVILN